jgi:hypothetical protein
MNPRTERLKQKQLERASRTEQTHERIRIAGMVLGGIVLAGLGVWVIASFSPRLRPQKSDSRDQQTADTIESSGRDPAKIPPTPTNSPPGDFGANRGTVEFAVLTADADDQEQEEELSRHAQEIETLKSELDTLRSASSMAKDSQEKGRETSQDTSEMGETPEARLENYVATMKTVQQEVEPLRDEWAQLFVECSDRNYRETTQTQGSTQSREDFYGTTRFTGAYVDRYGNLTGGFYGSGDTVGQGVSHGSYSETQVRTGTVRGWTEGCDMTMVRIFQKTADVIRKYDAVYEEYHDFARESGQLTKLRFRDMPRPDLGTRLVGVQDIVATLNRR